MDPQEDLENWRLAEKAALEAEAAVAAMGQGASDPRAAALLARAGELRNKADAMLGLMLQKSGARPPSLPE